MSDFLIYLPFLAAAAIVFIYALHRVRCPDCGASLPKFYSPLRKTQRMWRAGGYLCAQCGCETDTAGRRVTADTPLPPIPVRQWALVGVLLMVALGLLTAGWFIAGRAVAAPPVVAAPVVALPQQAPPVAPVN